MKVSGEESNAISGEHSLGTWTRIYVHGVLAFVVLYVIAYVVTLLVPIFDFTGNRALAIGLSVFAILAGPPVVGSLVLFGIFPLIGKKKAWRGLLVWDNRLISELDGAKQNAQIVIINWPSDEVRTMGVLTKTFTNASNQELAAVYVPTAPQTRYGYIRVIPLDHVEMTDWTFKQWQMYQLTFGCASPDRTTLRNDD